MNKRLKVALNLPLYGTFDYFIQHNSTNINVGTRVQVSFGKKELIGIVSEIKKHSQETTDRYKLKPINEILDTEPVLTKEIIKLCKWASNYYQYPIGQVYFNCIPSKLKKSKDIKNKEIDDRKFFYKITNKETDEYFKNKTAQKRIYDYIKNKCRVDPSDLKSSKPLNEVLNNGFIEKYYLDDEKVLTDNIILNEEQERAYKKIIEKINVFTPSLIEGVTGSGKTELYIKIVEKIVSDKGQALIIVPEINLTPQTLKRFKKYLNYTISEYHSSISENKKYEIWEKCRQGKIDILIGTRSAIFLPFKSLKIIIIDEEHDASLKQSEKFRYHARDLSLVRAKNLNIPILMGSATPSFESLYNCKIKKYNHILLKTRFFKTKLPTVKVVDITKDTTIDGFSSNLIGAIKDELKAKKQILLFVGRRGYSSALLCKTCGWTSKCYKCDAYMTFHKKDNILWCHHCGYKKILKTQSFCNSTKECQVVPLGIGTERVEKKCKELFPGARTMRIDSDSINSISKLKDFIKKTQSKEVDILVGTQMLVKGHDFPDLNLVGIIDIDAGLYSLDFRGIEKIGQMIIQVAGRSGRHNNQGKLIIQTRKPDNMLINELLSEGYHSFSKKALVERNLSSFPPYSYLSLFRVSSLKKNEGMSFLMKVKNNFNQNMVTLLGPAPAPIMKKNNRYYYQLLINTKNRNLLLSKTSEIREYIIKQKKSNIRWSIDIDPIDLY